MWTKYIDSGFVKINRQSYDDAIKMVSQSLMELIFQFKPAEVSYHMSLAALLSVFTACIIMCPFSSIYVDRHGLFRFLRLDNFYLPLYIHNR